MFAQTNQSIRQNAEKVVLRAKFRRFTTESSAVVYQVNYVVTITEIFELLKNTLSVP